MSRDGGFVTEYELLRTRATGGASTASGLAVALVLREGLRSWIAAAGDCARPAPPSAPTEPSAAVGDPRLIATLADIALACLEARA